MLTGAIRTIAHCLRARGVLLPILALACVLVAAPSTGIAQDRTEPSKEFQVKAAFLFNFAKYVKWPERAFAKDDSPLIVGVVGKDPFGTVLDRAFAGKSIDKHPLVVRRFRDVDKLGPCHLLFVPADEDPRTAKIAAHYAKTPTLLVGDGVEFAKKGGVIGFYLADKRVRFEINTDAAERTGVEVSSQLLKLARIVRDKERRR